METTSSITLSSTPPRTESSAFLIGSCALSVVRYDSLHSWLCHVAQGFPHKLADLANLTLPWAIDANMVPRDTALVGFKNTTENVPITLEDLEREYCRLTKQPYPIKEMTFARSWMLFRVRSHTSYQLASRLLRQFAAGGDRARDRSSLCAEASQLGKGLHVQRGLPSYWRTRLDCHKRR